MKRLIISLGGICLLLPGELRASPYALQYGGRVTNSVGRPLTGPISINVNFFHAASGGAHIASKTFTNVTLIDGLFNLTIDLPAAEYNTIFSGAEVWLEITDITSGKIYPRQKFGAVPYAMRVPVDGTSMSFNANGELQLSGLKGSALPAGNPADGQVLKWKDGTGWEWGSAGTGGSATIDSTAIQDGAISDADVAAAAAIAGTKIAPNFGAQNITTTGTISGDGSGLTNLPAGPLGSAIESSEITDGTIVNADIAAGAAIDQSKINGLAAALAAREAAITAGTSAQYFRGDKSWATLDTAAIPENTNLYYTDARARAAVSATAPLAYNQTTGVFSLPSATSVANGYLSSGDWLTFSNKQAAISAASTVNTGTLTTALQAGLQLEPFGTNAGETGELRFKELTASGSNYIGFKAPSTLASDLVYVLPPTDGSGGQFLSTDGSGNLTWGSVVGGSGGTVTSITAGTGLTGGTITGSGTINLANTAVTPGSYTRSNITVDAQGRLTAAANGGSLNLASEVTGTLPVASGGTGGTTAPLARTALSAAASGANSDITSITGLTTALSLAQGGTGATTSGDARTALSAAASGANSDITSISGLTTALSIAQGGTGATTAGDARTALGLGGLATLSAVTTTQITDATIADADISGTAAIAQSKIANLTSDLSGLSSGIAGKEATITAGTTAQYWRGDKSWQTLDTSIVPENTNLYFTDARARAAVSGTAPVSYNSGTGAFSMAAATSVANGYLSSGDWLTFNSKQAAISAVSTVNTGTLTTALQNGLELKPFGTNAGEAGEIRFNELVANGSEYVGFKAPNAIGTTRIWTLPAADGTNGQVLSTSGTGTLSWTSAGGVGTVTSITAGTGLSGGTINGSGTIDLANTAVSAGSYSRADITVDAQGRLTAAANGSAVNLASEVSGTLPLANGGTGATTATDARTALGLGALATLSAVTTTEITDDTIADADISATAGIVDSKLDTIATAGKVSNSATTATSSNTNSAIVARDGSGNFSAGTITAALVGNASTATTAGNVTGTVAIANGGTGATSAALARTALGVAASGANSDITSLSALTSMNSTNIVIGTGDGTGTLGAGNLRGPAASGSNIAGSDILISASNGTGTGGSGKIKFQTAAVGSSGASANTLADRMTIDPAGFVGIGTTTPKEGLHLDGSILVKPYRYLSSNLYYNGGWKYTENGYGMQMYFDGDGGVYFASAGNNVSGADAVASPGTKFILTNDGKIGFGGITTPKETFHMGGNILLKPNTYISSNVYYESGWKYFENGYGGLMKFNSAGDITFETTGNNSSGTGAAATTSEKMVLLNNGKLGINLSAPVSRLDVGGSASMRATAGSVLTGSINPTASTTLTGVGTLFTQELTPGDRITVSGETRTVTAIASNTSLTVDEATTNTANDTTPDRLPAALTVKDASNGVKFVVNDSGNVGIGTTAPIAPLDILAAGGKNVEIGGGAITGSEIKFTNSGTAHFSIYNSGNYGLTIAQTSDNLGPNIAGAALMTFTDMGKVGIGTTGPYASLQVVGGIMARGGAPGGNGSDNNGYAFSGNSGDNDSGMFSLANDNLSFYTAAAARVHIDPYGYVGIGTTVPSHILHITGQGRATSSAWTTTSDIRLKDVQGPFEGYGLNEIKQIETIRFRYKKDNPLNLPWREDHIGVSAQQLQTLIPDAVVLQSDGYLTVNTDPVFWTIVNSVKELAQENEDLKAASERKDTDIAQLKAEAAALKAESAGLKKFICSQFPSADYCSGP